MNGLPSGWIEATLGDLCEFNPKHDPETDRATTVSFIPMPAVDDETGSIVDRSAIRLLSEVWKGYTHFADADVIFAKITPCMENGKIAVARGLENGMACGSTEFHVLRSKGAVKPDFVWRFLRRRSYRLVAERSMTGAVGQRRVPKPFLEGTVLPLPPLAEQKRIVAKLDTLNAASARARTELAGIETLVSRYKQAVLSKAFSEVVPRKVVAELVARIKAGKNLRCEERPPHSHEKGVVKVSAVTWGEFRADQSKTLPPDFRPDEDTRIRAGDFLFSRANTIELVGAVVIVAETPDNLYLSDKILRLEFNEPIGAWLLWYLRSPEGREALMNISSGNQLSMRNIGQKSLLSLSVPYADSKSRNEIVRHIESAFAKIDRLAKEAKRSLELLGKLDEAILAKAFRGDLVPQDENDEPAERLLARIRAERNAAPKAKRGRSRKQT